MNDYTDGFAAGFKAGWEAAMDTAGRAFAATTERESVPPRDLARDLPNSDVSGSEGPSR